MIVDPVSFFLGMIFALAVSIVFTLVVRAVS